MANIAFFSFLLLSIASGLMAKKIPECKGGKVCELNDTIIFFDVRGPKEFQTLINQHSNSSKKIWEFRNLTMLGSAPEGSFQNTKLHTLIFRDFAIKKLSKNAFAGLENSLKDFILINPKSNANWNMKELARLSQLERLTISHNAYNQDFSITDFAKIGGKSIKHLQFTGACMDAVLEGQLNSFTSLERLELQGNQISRLKKNSFPKKSKLKFIDLSNNKIKTLEAETFTDMPYLELVSLNNNELECILIGHFQLPDEPGIGIRAKYLIYDNPRIICDDRITHLLKYINYHFIDEEEGRQLQCGQPTDNERVMGKEIGSLTESDLPPKGKPCKDTYASCANIYLPITYMPLQICDANSWFNVTQ